MTRINALRHEFVSYIPEPLDFGMLYVSIPFTTVAHLCCCGCGNEVVTPLDPADWQMTFDGKSVSLYPSIGSWGLSCQSHYWIHRNQVRWAQQHWMFKIKRSYGVYRFWEALRDVRFWRAIRRRFRSKRRS